MSLIIYLKIRFYKKLRIFQVITRAERIRFIYKQYSQIIFSDKNQQIAFFVFDGHFIFYGKVPGSDLGGDA